MKKNNIWDEERQRKAVKTWLEKPDVFAESFRLLKDPKSSGLKRFSLKDWPFWRPVFRHFKREAKNVTVILKCSRKVAKSTNISNLFNYALKMFNGVVLTYTSGKQEIVSRFIKEIFKESVEASVGDYFKKDYDGGTPTQLRFKTNIDGIKNWVYSYTAWGKAGSLLGIAGDIICVDECQDMPSEGWFAKLNEIMATSSINWLLIAGTARDAGDQFDKRWKSTDQREWIVTCEECGGKQTPYLNRDNLMWTDGSTRKKKMETAYIGCQDCGKEIDVKNGVWIAKRPGNMYIGYHMNQLMNPIIPVSEIVKKMLNPNYTRRDFDNEVLGSAWEGKARPLSMAKILRNCVDEKIEYNKEKVHSMGIDWGESDTIIILNEDKELIHACRVAESFKDEIEEIKRLIEKYDVDIVMADFGYGARQIRELQDDYGNKVRGVQYVSSIDNPIKYERYNKQGVPIYRYKVDKTHFVDRTIDNFENEELSIPYSDECPEWEWIIGEYNNLKGDTEGKSKRMKYGRYGDDHSFHSTGYALFGLDESSKYEEIHAVFIDQ